MAFIELDNINKTYGSKDTLVEALKDVNFTINKNEFVVILGPSGAGKTTLLNILGGMDSASSGKYLVDGIDITTMNDKELARFRREKIGFVFQFYNLMANLTALENVKLATKKISLAANPREMLLQVGLENREKNFPSALSGGEQQRVSIARALVKRPAILLCDEPTGALDSVTGKKIIALLKEISRKQDGSVIVVTHNSKIADCADRVLKLNDGKIVADYYNESPCEVDDIIW